MSKWDIRERFLLEEIDRLQSALRAVEYAINGIIMQIKQVRNETPPSDAIGDIVAQLRNHTDHPEPCPFCLIGQLWDEVERLRKELATYIQETTDE